VLVGREAERSALDRLLHDARAGTSGALLLLGEPGIGKTSLVDDAVARADGMLVVRVHGVESEAAVAFAGLVELLRPLLGKLDELPAHHAGALRVALTLEPGPPPDRLTLGAATLGVLAAAAEDTALLVAVDDAHWLDAESLGAIAFAARRLQAERIAAVIAARTGEGRDLGESGLPAVVLAGLSASATGELLAAGGKQADVGEAERMRALTAGNPLALIELPTVGVLPQVGPAPIGERLENAFAARADALPERARTALLVLAAGASDDPAALAAGLAELDLLPDDLGPAEDAGLIQIGLATVRFRHPLVRSALYQSASPSARRDAHRAFSVGLAERDPDAAVWHRAASVVGPDEDVARALEKVGDRNAARGASRAASAAYDVAARLTGDQAAAARRLLPAARQAWLAGDDARARSLVAEASAARHEPTLRAGALHLQGEIELITGSPVVAHRMLIDAAAIVAEADPAGAAVMLADATDACLHLGPGEYAETESALERLAPMPGDVAEFRRQAALSQIASYRSDGTSTARALGALAQLDGTGREPATAADLHRAGRVAWSIGDYTRAEAFGSEAAGRARETALGVLPEALRLVAVSAWITGRWNVAYAVGSEAVEVASELGRSLTRCATLAVLASIAAARGQQDACDRHAGDATRAAEELEMAMFILRADRARALAALGAGRLDEAALVLEQVRAELARTGNREFSISPLPDLIETLVRADRAEDTDGLLDELERRTELAGEQAIFERCRGLLADDDAFPACFERAIELHTAWDNPFELARTRLCFGERLRRGRLRRLAREQLRLAAETFDGLTAAPWSARADGELRATGERVARRDPGGEQQLTPQELQIAAHAAEGLSNREIGAAVFLSPRTVEFHLTRVYRKLGLHSRAELIRHYAGQMGESPRDGGGKGADRTPE
jgi:DNA-binding CsgD family transcriptional regulator